ncbi:MAG: PrsW family glutamic-type intramembrane protease [Candidatus Spyradenecus sp.]
MTERVVGGYVPVVRGSVEEPWRSAGVQETARPIASERAMTEERPVCVNGEPLAWWRFLGRPWSWRWRGVFALGAGACLVLGVMGEMVPALRGMYALGMAAWIPLAVVTFFKEIEVTRRASWGMAAGVMVVGGAASLLISLGLYALLGVKEAGFAGVIEEPAKAAVLVVLSAEPGKRHGQLTGLLLGACVGAGFAIPETVVYAYGFGGAAEPSTFILLIRGLLSPFCHIAWTGALGGAIGAARGKQGSLGAIFASGLFWAILGGMVLSHCLWNFVGPITYAAVALWALLFHFIKRGAAEAAAEGFYPQGEN